MWGEYSALFSPESIVSHAWKSYDSAAGTHDRLAVPTMFAPPARDLVMRAGLPPAGRVLDLGTGTGAVGAAALEHASPDTMVMGIDPSLEMVRVARNNGLLHVAVGVAPGLPYRDATFDRVLANFVLSHVKSYAAALAAVMRVLCPGGKLGATAWGSLSNEFRDRWGAIAESFAGKEALRAAAQEAIPWDDWFAEPGRLRRAFHEAGFIEIEEYNPRYTAQITIADFLNMRENSMQGSFICQALSTGQWRAFKEALAADFHRRFRDPFEHVRDVHIVIGKRPET
jgi:ubiquinone/menaquinone biosynthesis C-methylase UbiE